MRVTARFLVRNWGILTARKANAGADVNFFADRNLVIFHPYREDGMQYRKKPVVIEAHQWFKNGDHPLDHDPIGYANPTSTDLDRYWDYKQTEGKVVRYYRRPDVSGDSLCEQCGEPHHGHGWIDTLEQGHRVCPGDFIITGVKGEMYPCKPDIFEATYEPIGPEMPDVPDVEG
ncbi:hypothetical protein [Herbaspirillum sp. ST 5-3]|uniref:hypothetical protein n=1 Tax=Oxalobacteraceae TaxID=75682 RepID=UPI001B3B8606|nr:hypothetical protein [Herbaspirillum sp. ST 5-3]